MAYASRYVIRFLLSVVLVSGAAQKPHGAVPIWSKQATPISFEEGARRMSVPSPGQRVVATLSGVRLSVTRNGKTLTGLEDTGIEPLAELLWAPDSNAFAITGSDGGDVGSWDVRAFILKDGVVQDVVITSEIKPDFKTRFTCQDDEDPNFGALTWVDGSSRLVVIAEVPPHSSCNNMGSLTGYEILVPSGKIVSRYSESQVRERWGQVLGRRLLRPH